MALQIKMIMLPFLSLRLFPWKPSEPNKSYQSFSQSLPWLIGLYFFKENCFHTFGYESKGSEIYPRSQDTFSPLRMFFLKNLNFLKSLVWALSSKHSSDLQIVPLTLSQYSISGVISQSVACHIKGNGFTPTCSHNGHECLKP